MIEVELFGGMNLDEAYDELKAEAKKTNDVCFAMFNGKKILSTETKDEIYKKVTGKTKAEFDEAQRKWLEDYRRSRAEYEAKIPKLTEHYRKAARGIIAESDLEEWDEVVPIRLGDIYHGMELGETLETCKIMADESVDYDERLHKAYDRFMDAGHSGSSAVITASMYKRFCPHGEDVADAVMNFRFKKED
jgi:hypothetical protein